MELSPGAARALEALRIRNHTLRFTVDEVCHSGRHRLSVRWPGEDGAELRLGLLYGEDRPGLCDLRDRLAGDHSAST